MKLPAREVPACLNFITVYITIIACSTSTAYTLGIINVKLKDGQGVKNKFKKQAVSWGCLVLNMIKQCRKTQSFIKCPVV